MGLFIIQLESLVVPGTIETYASRINHIKERIGNTPIAHLDTVNGNRIYAKLEHLNPFSLSVKDRAAAYMLTGPLERGEINPLEEKVWIEASSGNLGIAYGKIGSYLGIKTFIVVPSVTDEETIEILKESVSKYMVTPGGYCPGGERDGAIKMVADLWMEDPRKYEFRDQYRSRDNIKAHVETTGPEFWNQTNGEITHLVLAPGTGGTIIGSARYLKSQNPEIKIITVQPQRDHKIQGVRNFEESMKSIIFSDNEDLIDDWVHVGDKEAFQAMEGLWNNRYPVGFSSGLNYAAAKKIAKKEENAVIATLFPANGRGNTNTTTSLK
ncbi:MAG: pyridoxal-phosphate dependent enzyme [Candidatus Bathyarchaeota archaeon]|nr:pyridoxal-phosphate dependent enzyme [Candidatus Bathyarchaeota archaeon]MDP7207287.1 pyridoxal-phosphate dependent enzyme [Candidatus Bathyarchaeota archaeon]MDP7442778.1 pyridoxal-phosphate dependent enzyme [Candidatus Bathyarchaeota archaeon]